MISTIADELRASTSNQLKNVNFISIMIDGATDRSVSENEVVFVRLVEDGTPVNKLVSLCEAELHMLMAIDKSFKSIEFESYRDKIIGFCADGASVNLGQSNGVVAKLREKIPHVIDIHCMAHRLELSVLQIKNKNTLIKKLNDVLHLIWKTYKYSGKSLRELKTIGEELEARIYASAPVKGTRWLPHIDRAIKTFIEGKGDGTVSGLIENASQYGVIHSHMEHLGESSTNADIQGRGKFVSKEMKSLCFVSLVHFMADVFGVLAKMSLKFQKGDIILPTAVLSVRDTCVILEEMKTEPIRESSMLSIFFEALNVQIEHGNSEIKFQGLTLIPDHGISWSSYKNDIQAKFSPILTLIISEIRKRFDNLLGANKDEQAVKVINAFSVFNHDTWQDSNRELIHFGNDLLEILVEHFHFALERAGCDFNLLNSEWRQLKLLVGNEFSRKSYNSVWKTECERGFSAQKRIKSDIRSSLSISRLSDLIFISTEGPEIESFQPESAVSRWMASGKRRPCAKPE
ncbi:hypothetical protein KUTeg_000173, partial [Tegillarca granosa]